ncbi:MAG: glycosyltransferase family 9 protein [Planctomycetota bacterium]
MQLTLPTDAKRILLIRPSALGDVARSVPLVAALRRARPNARIEWMIQAEFTDIASAHPAVDEVIPFPRASLGRDLRRLRLTPPTRWAQSLRDRAYDAVIDAQGLLRSAAIAAITGAKFRAGFADARECAGLLYTRRVRSTSVHTVDRMLDLIRAIGIDPCPAPPGLSQPASQPAFLASSTGTPDMRLYLPPGVSDPNPASDTAAEASPIVIAPTSRWPAKAWPIERYAELTSRLLAQHASRVVIIGAPSERAACGPLLELAKTDPRVIDRVGKLAVSGAMREISAARLIVANDSAAAHIAVGFDRPIVALYGPTDVSKVGPYRRSRDVLQHRTPQDTLKHKDARNAAMMARITVDEVLAACRERL